MHTQNAQVVITRLVWHFDTSDTLRRGHKSHALHAKHTDDDVLLPHRLPDFFYTSFTPLHQNSRHASIGTTNTQSPRPPNTQSRLSIRIRQFNNGSRLLNMKMLIIRRNLLSCMDVGKIRFAAWGRGHAVSDIVYGRCCLMDWTKKLIDFVVTKAVCGTLHCHSAMSRSRPGHNNLGASTQTFNVTSAAINRMPRYNYRCTTWP